MDQSESTNKEMERLHFQLRLVQQAYIQQGLKAVIVLEGVDAAGKGGLIRRLAWSMDPRALKVWPIAAPTEIEKGMHYLWRFWTKIPAPGEIAVFDRSWYGRVLVERVEKITEKKIIQKAYGEINDFEKSLASDGIKIVKVLLKISKKEQVKRLKDRLEDPEKNWKLTFDDIRNRNKWDQYESAYKDMLTKTGKQNAGWKVIETDDKLEARIQALSYIVKTLSKGVSLKPKPISKKLVRELNKISKP